MTILPDLPGIPSYYTPLTVESAEKAPLDALICRSFLALHRESAGSGGRIRSIEHIPSTDKKGALALTAAMFKRAVRVDAPKGISSIDHLAAFLLHLEQGHAREKLLEDFSKLTTEDKTFLCYHLWQGMGRPAGDPDYGLHEIQKDPSILRRIKTADGKNLVEKLIDIRTEQKILPELQELIGKSREEIQASAHYNLLCWFVWWHDGGKDDSHFGEEDYGRKQLAADPDRLTSCIESLIKEINNKAALIEMPGLHYEGTALPQYKDLDRQVFREMVEDLLKDDSVNLCTYIQKFGITDQAVLIEIAKIAARTPKSNLCQHIQNFGIADPAELVEIAKIAAGISSSGFCFHIQNFGITDQAALVEIAKISAAIPTTITSMYIRRFRIKEQKDLVEIAKIAAATPNENFCWSIQSFGIKDPTDLFEIAKIAAATPGTDFYSNMQNFGITDPTDLFEIAKIAASASDSEFYRYIEDYRLFGKEQREAVLEIASDHYLKTIPGSITAEKRANVKKTISAILDIRDSALRIETFDLFRSSIDNLEFQERYFALVADGVHKSVPMIYIAFWLNEATMPVEAIPKIINIFKQFRSDFKNAHTKLSPLMLSLLRCIHQQTIFTFEDAIKLLEQVCDISPDSETLKKNLGLVLSLVKLGFFHEKGIAALPESFTQKDLMDALTSKIAMPLFGKAELSPDEINSYLLLSASQRVPFALELYASAIQNAETKVEMVRFVGSVLDDSYRSLRYTPADNPHLEALSSMTLAGASAAPQSLLVRWQDLSIKDTDTPAAGGAGAGAGAGAAATAAASTVGEEARLPSFGDWLRDKLVKDAHLKDADTKLPNLMGLLRSGKDLRVEAAKILTSGVKINDVEKACLEATCKDSKAERLISLKKLKEAAEKNTDLKGSQWIRDMQDLIQMMGSTNETSYKAQITDDWQDMFFCGTEVLGSCQAIQGTPSFNKCLLGYCMDGKIQMAVLKEPASGKILARALLKLLIKEEKQVDGTVRRVPVIFLERVYPDNPDYTKALNELAKARARYLGLELYTHNNSIETGAGSEVQLHSYGTSGPYEYEDGGVGISKGVYTIAHARKVVL